MLGPITPATRLAFLLLVAMCPSAATANGTGRIPVQPFATLPADVRHPEGLAVNPGNGEVYVGTFDARMPESARNNQVLRYSADGRLLARKSFGATPLTGVEYHDGKVYVLNFGASKLQRLAAAFDAETPVEDVAAFAALAPSAPPARTVDNPDGSQDRIAFGSNGFAGINGMTFDRAGHLYVSDSFQGAVYRIADAAHCAPCRVETIKRDPLFATAGPLPFGANGLAFNADESLLYVTNAGDGRLLRMAMPDGAVGIVAESVHGADGLLFHGGLLWVAANQADTVVALDETGRIRHRAGDFRGIGADGAPLGLLFPATTAVQGNRMIVANLALPLTPATGDEWEEDVTRWNLVRFDLPAPSRSTP